MSSHHIKIVTGDYSVHHVSPMCPRLFMPRCRCKWEGAWVMTRGAASQHGSEHARNPAVF
jgi:hypothetical protein